ncbi:hypothetical protein FRUB_04478 [Fimbriiglobus ruber]|uniref:Uncharacterized protein n=1 Tax=Fimbriiglobus ruber TaxID=1908690 RepID=A0A225DLQ5_9BACT|nr:hypothetical protein FRUB_04478 [Fimbriiglobus ruber]
MFIRIRQELLYRLAKPRLAWRPVDFTLNCVKQIQITL